MIKKVLLFFVSRVFLINLVIALVLGSAIIYGTLSYLNSYTLHGEEITVPDFRGKTIEDVEDMIEEKKLRYVVIDSVYDDVMEKGAIVEQNPAPMDRVKENRRIYFTVNAILPPLVTLPDLKDKSKRQAVAILDVIGVKVDSLQYEPDICEDCVLKIRHKGNEVPFGSKIKKGDKITLVLGAGQNGGKTIVPVLIGRRIDEVREILTDQSLNLGVSNFDETVSTEEDSASAVVYRQRPFSKDEDEEILLGSIVDVWLTADTLKVPDLEELDDEFESNDDQNDDDQ